jgi:hypothetical protein
MHNDIDRQTRDWTAPDGTVYKVTLEPPLRQLLDSGDRRRIITFRDRANVNAIERVRFAPEALDLGAASNDTLTTILRTR